MSKTIEERMLEERKAYFKQWRANNRDKIREHNQNYWRKRAEKKQMEEE